MIGVTIVASVISLIQWRINKELRLITYYLLATSLIDIISSYYEIFSKDRNKEMIMGFCSEIYVMTELTIFFAYLYKNIVKVRMRIIIKIIFILFFLLISCISATHYFHYYDHPGYSITAIESLFIIIPCLFYFYELFLAQQIDLRSHPSFWIVSGILFYNCCSIPIFLLFDYIQNNISPYYNLAFALNYIL